MTSQRRNHCWLQLPLFDKNVAASMLIEIDHFRCPDLLEHLHKFQGEYLMEMKELWATRQCSLVLKMITTSAGKSRPPSNTPLPNYPATPSKHFKSESSFQSWRSHASKMPREESQDAITEEEIAGTATPASSASPPRNACTSPLPPTPTLPLTLV